MVTVGPESDATRTTDRYVRTDKGERKQEAPVLVGAGAVEPTSKAYAKHRLCRQALVWARMKRQPHGVCCGVGLFGVPEAKTCDQNGDKKNCQIYLRYISIL